jgi:tRNA-Thr(GGU) m(6)t(6)A37 methyltransferase TsaA
MGHSNDVISVEPIGFLRTDRYRKFDAPNQPDVGESELHTIEINDDPRLEQGLQDLESFDFIWILSWMDRNRSWRPRVLPPRGPAKRRGVFATRSPHRPNPIALTATRLHRIDGRILTIGAIDLIDGTPVLDIKPYLRTVDSFPEAGLGWLEPIQAEADLPPRFQIEVSEQAQLELAFLKSIGISFTDRAFRILERNPEPHRTRRIMNIGDGLFRIACGSWRMYYRVHGNVLQVVRILPSYKRESLERATVDRDAQRLFYEWLDQANLR